MLNHAKDHMTWHSIGSFYDSSGKDDPAPLFWDEENKIHGHTGARTQDRGVISTALYQLSYTTAAVLLV